MDYLDGIYEVGDYGFLLNDIGIRPKTKIEFKKVNNSYTCFYRGDEIQKENLPLSTIDNIDKSDIIGLLEHCYISKTYTNILPKFDIGSFVRVDKITEKDREILSEELKKSFPSDSDLFTTGIVVRQIFSNEFEEWVYVLDSFNNKDNIEATIYLKNKDNAFRESDLVEVNEIRSIHSNYSDGEIIHIKIKLNKDNLGGINKAKQELIHIG